LTITNAFINKNSAIYDVWSSFSHFDAPMDMGERWFCLYLLFPSLCFRPSRAVEGQVEAHLCRDRTARTEAGFLCHGTGTFTQQAKEPLAILSHARIVCRAAGTSAYTLEMFSHLFLLILTHFLHFLHRFFEFVHKNPREYELVELPTYYNSGCLGYRCPEISDELLSIRHQGIYGCDGQVYNPSSNSLPS
jgi:hypothetical protein